MSDDLYQPLAETARICESTKPERGGRETMHDWHYYFEGLVNYHPVFRADARDYVRRLEALQPLDPKARVLDFGCGFGFVADALAPKVGELFLWDASENMSRFARANVSKHANVQFLNLAEPGPLPRDIRFDLILVNSVVQYMSLDDFSLWLARWRDMLAPNGRLIISDLIPHKYKSIWDLVAEAMFCARHGFLAHALREGLGEVKRYWMTRRARPLSQVEHTDLRRRAAAAGLSVEFSPNNLTHRTRRITVVLYHALKNNNNLPF